MLTKLTVTNFKRFGAKVEIELGNPVVFIGPNNSGKTTALQALALWDVGVRRWSEKRSGRATPEKRPGVTINRRDLIAVPVPDANLLWRDLHVRDTRVVGGHQSTQNIRIDVVVEGVTGSEAWTCGLEFDYANEESFYCRPLRTTNEKDAPRMPVPDAATRNHVAFLPPMSGLADREFAKQQGETSFLIGQGRTAEVLRNLCLQIYQADNGPAKWNEITGRIKEMFGVELELPTYVSERSEITLSYREPSGVRLDLSSAGRGLHQTLLLLAHLVVNPGSVLLLDEPDAHLELLRQRQTYQLLTEVARQQGSQIVAASHSEVVLNEAADRDVVVAFVGRPHRVDDRGSQLLKSLKSIGFEQYYQAEQKGWVLYLEGSTDWAILRAFAEKLGHRAKDVLSAPFVHYVENQPSKARDHFWGLHEAKKNLVGFLLCDRMPLTPGAGGELIEHAWSRREIENYLCQPQTLVEFAASLAGTIGPGPLFDVGAAEDRRQAMQASIDEFVPRAALRDLHDPWWHTTKVSDDFLDRLFPAFFKALGLPNLMDKSDYHQLARFVSVELLDPEIPLVLDQIAQVADRARPATGEDGDA